LVKIGKACTFGLGKYNLEFKIGRKQKNPPSIIWIEIHKIKEKNFLSPCG
jgi:hypothetical protein